MTQGELVKIISNTLGKPKVLELGRILTEQKFSLDDLIDITFYPDSMIAFRASWILENMLLADPIKYEPELEYFFLRFKQVKYHGPQRHYIKILMHLTDPKMNPVIKRKLETIDLEPAVEQCFDSMIDPKAKIAVKVFASEALFNLRHRYDWVAEELANQIQFLMRNGSPAIQSRGKKLLAMLFVN
ncbi:hypothetical protein [Mucilaginibacter sp.]|uniref:hypothetical protein n=1 Tax=Mucilaginibacter sp. TaxID=1882438 RepID=UPI0025FA19BA|nr:hypothetical protein [Mucilaginibacter sp.]